MSEPHIVVSRDEHQIGSFPVDKEAILIGRKSDNDICLNSLSISGHHSKIISIIDSFFLEDLNSTNGTFVNSRPIKKHVLQNGDLIQIGNHQLEFIAPEEHPDTVAEKLTEEDILEQTIVLSADELEQSIHHTTQPPQEKSTPDHETSEFPMPSVAPAQGKLQIVNGKHAGTVLELSKSLTTFGSPGTSVAGITKRSNGHFLIRVQGQTESIRLNGEPAPQKAQRLEEHDIVEVAGIKLEFYLE